MKSCELVASFFFVAFCVLAQDRGLIHIPEAQKFALVIGNSEYPKAPLKNPVNDAGAVEATLRKLGFNVTTVRNADLRKMRTAIDEFAARLVPGSLGFFYFAGHGIQVNSTNYLLPIDFSAASEDDVAYEAYPANRIQAKLEGSGARLRVIVLDACRNNPFRFKRDATEGLAPMAISAEGTLVAFATGDNNTAAENPGETNGLYTKFLLPALVAPGLNLRAAFQKAKEEVYQASQHQQNPSIYENIVGQYALVANGPVNVTVQNPSVDAAAETWALIKDSQNADDFDSFIQAFPQSDLARGAAVRAAQLRRGNAVVVRTNVASVPPLSTHATASAPPADDRLAVATKWFDDRDYDNALPVFRSAAEAGNAEAQMYLGRMYANGQGVLKDDAQALIWSRKAADGGNLRALATIGVMYEAGRGGLGKDELEALKYYRKAADAGDPRGLARLGNMYALGTGGLTRDEVQAASLYRRAAEGGEYLGMLNLARMYGRGAGGLPKDDVQAGNWLRRAAETGDPAAMTNVGDFYLQGLFLPQDAAVAVSLYRKAAEAGNSGGMNSLGTMYERGLGGLSKDDAQAATWYRKSATAGNAAAMNNLGILFQEGRGGLGLNEVEALGWFRKGAEAGNVDAMHNIGLMYSRGRAGLNKNEKTALSWFRQAAEGGNAASMYDIGHAYEVGRGAYPEDKNQAFIWYRKAAKAGYSRADEAIRRLSRQP